VGELVLHFTKPGLQTLVQDEGRFGFQGVGIPIGGAMDKPAAQMANYLVGNMASSPVLEITLLGPVIVFKGIGQIAICGANLSPKLNGDSVNNAETISISDGDILDFGQNISGCRAYLAIGGDWQVDRWLNSCAAAAFDAQHLSPQSIIKKGDTLKVFTAGFIEKRLGRQPVISSSIVVKVLPGPEFYLFSSLEMAYFFSTSFHLSPASNRMGCRLVEAIPNLKTNTNIISSAMFPGTVQITPLGHPIVLMMDAQTTGGYARIVQIQERELPKLAQACVGDEVRFCL